MMMGNPADGQQQIPGMMPYPMMQMPYQMDQIRCALGYPWDCDGT